MVQGKEGLNLTFKPASQEKVALRPGKVLDGWLVDWLMAEIPKNPRAQKKNVAIGHGKNPMDLLGVLIYMILVVPD